MLDAVEGMEINNVLLNTELQKYHKMPKRGKKYTAAAKTHSFNGATKEDETPTKDCNDNNGDTMLSDKTRISEDLDAVKKRECSL